jgi:hypothetical protein
MSDCILFEGHVRGDGYGIISRSRNGKTRIFMAHRWHWAKAHDKDPWSVPNWLRIKHSCEINSCINPEHLVTDTDQKTIDLLPAADPDSSFVLQKPGAKPAGTPGELRIATKTTCSEGHAFRDAPEDTPCRSCRLNKKLLARYEVA